jgi:hypothetical protein
MQGLAQGPDLGPESCLQHPGQSLEAEAQLLLTKAGCLPYSYQRGEPDHFLMHYLSGAH